MLVTSSSRHWFHLVALVNLLLFQRTLVTANEAGTNSDLEDSMFTLMDSILEDLTQKYDSIKTDDFWHPYDFGTGNDNREVISVVNVMEHEIMGKFIQWKKVQLGLKQQLIGLTASSVEIYDSKLERTIVKDLPLTLETMDVFTRWDSENFTPYMVIVVATSSPSVIMLTSTGQEEIKEVGSFPLSSSVQSVMVGMVESSEKVMLVPANAALPISIYNIEVSQQEAQLWFFQRVSAPGFESVIVHRPDTVDSMLLISRANQLSIYHFDTSLGQFSVQQTLPLPQKCSGMLSFTMMYQHYISCMTKDASEQVQFISYNFNMNEYEESALKKVKATEMFPVTISGSRGDLILVSRNAEDNAVNTLTYDGQNEFLTGNIRCASANCAKLSTLSNGVSFEFEDNTALVLPTSTEEDKATVLAFETEVIAASSPVLQQSKGLFDEFKALSSDMNRWRTSVSNAEKILKRKLDTNGNNIITGNWDVKTLVAEDVDVNDGRDGRAATSDNVFNILKFGDVHWTEEDFASTNAQISSSMDAMRSNLVFIKTELDDALKKHFQGVQIVKSSVSMQGKFLADNVATNVLNVKSMWDRDATEYFLSLAHKQSDVLKIEGGLTFTELLTAVDVTTEKLNKVSVDSMAVLNGDNVFECSPTFERIHTLRDIAVTVVNGHNLADSVVMAHDVTGFNFVDGILVFMGAESTEHTPFDDVLLSSVAQTVESPTLFDSMEVSAPMSVDVLNGKKFKEFTEKVITKDYQGKITGTKRFLGAMNLTTLFITNQWNGLTFPNEFVSIFDDSVILNGENSFADVVVNKISVSKNINGVNTGDLVSLTETEVMDKSAWTFTGATKILNNIAVANRVDGVLMESLLHQGILDSSTAMFHPNADIVFSQPVHIEDLSVSSTVNDKSFEDIFGSLILFEGTDCRVPGKTTVSEASTFGDLVLTDNKINDFSVENFLTRDTPQTISKPVVIAESVFFEEIHALEHFDGVKVQDVLERAMRVSEKTKFDGTMIPWDIHFQSIECKSSFTVDGPINDLAAYQHNVALTKGERSQIINGPIESINPVFSTLASKNLELTSGRTLQTLDVTAWNTARIKLSEPATFSHPLSATRITVQENLETPNINGIDVTNLRTGVFRNNGQPQEFSGPITLMKGLTVHNGDLRFHQHVDGFVLDDFIANGFPLNAINEAPIVIENAWQFESMKISNGIKISDQVCGVNLDALLMDSVKRNANNVQIFGDTLFTNPLQITGSLTSPQINGKQLDKVFLLNQDQVIETSPTFASDVFKDVLKVDSVNDVEIAWLAGKYSFVDGQHVLNHDTFIKNPFKTKSLSVGGKIRNHNLDEFIADAVQLSDPNIAFNDEFIMTQPISVEDIIRTVLYNGIDVDNLHSQAVQLDDDITLTQPVSFTGIVSAENVIVNGDVRASSLTNGVNWDDLQTKSITLNQPGELINFKNAHFEELVTSQPITASKLNERSFDDFVTLNTEQNLGTLKISNVFLDSSNVAVGGTVGSRDISEEFADTLMSNTLEPQRLSGKTFINGPIHIKQDISCFGSDLQKDIVSTSDDLELGPVEFTSPIIVENDVELTEAIQGHDVKSLFSGAFMTDNSEQVVSDRWEFHGPVTFLHNVTGQGVGDQVNIQALVDSKNEELRRAEQRVDAERDNFVKKCNALHTIRNKIAKNPVKLDSFDTHQVIGLKHEATNVLTVESDDNTMILVQTANCKLERYQWQPSTELFHKIVEESPVNIGSVDAWQSASLKDSGSVIVFSKSVSACSDEFGLFSVTVAPNGDLSPVSTLRSSLPTKSFKLVKKPDTGEIKLFNLINDINSGVELFTWNEKEFIFQEFFHLDSPMDRVDVTASSRGFGLMCHNEQAVTMYDISDDHTEDIEASGSMLASKSGTMAVFQNFDTLYALLAESGASSPSLIQPTCNFQVMRLNGGSIESVQKLQVPEVTSSALFSFSEKNFISFLSKSHGLTVYKFMGLNGFERVGNPYKIFGGFMLKSFSVKRPGLDRAQPFLLVLSKNTVEVYRGNVFGDSLNSDFEPLCND